MYTTKEAAEAAGVTQPTWRHRSRVLGLIPKDRDHRGAKYWSDEQVAAVRDIQATCRWCGSPYHTRCTLADSQYQQHHADQLADSGVVVVDWEERKKAGRSL